MEYHDYYGTLGVDKKASQADIQRAYRKLARQYHPDINRDAGAEARFKEIGEAYEVLKDPDKRSKYDRFGKAWKTQQATGAPPPGWEDVRFDFGTGPGGFDFGDGPSGFSSFFDMLFGGGGAGAGGGGWAPRQQAAPRRGADHRSTIVVGLEDIVRGATRKLSLTDPETHQTQTLEIKVPRGVRPGQKIRLAGKGGHGTQGGSPGDLLLEVELRPHPSFKVDGDDLVTPIPVSPSVAALGGEVSVPTLDGPKAVKLPAGSSSGRRIRLKNQGLPTQNNRRGDLYGEVKIVVPSELDDEQRSLFERLAAIDAERD